MATAPRPALSIRAQLPHRLPLPGSPRSKPLPTRRDHAGSRGARLGALRPTPSGWPSRRCIDEALERAYATLVAARPTAVNLKWAFDGMLAAVRDRPRAERPEAALRRASEIADEDVAINQAFGRHRIENR